MSNEQALYQVLSQDAGVLAFVGVGSPQEIQIYPNVVPPEVRPPFISFHTLSTEAHNKLTGRPASNRSEFEIGCVANEYEQAKALADAVRAALELNNGWLDSEGDEYYHKTQEHRVWLHWSLIG